MKELIVLLLLFIRGIIVAQDAQDWRIPPIIEEMGPEYIIYRSDEKITILCKASGIPTPIYKWTHNGRPLNLNAGHVKMSSVDGTLTFNPVTSLDEGYYQCIAQNLYGRDLSVVAWLRRAVLGRYPPQEPRIFSVDEGQAFVLPCAPVKSVPPPEFSWSLGKDVFDANPTSVALDERVQIDDNGNLNFAYITRGDSKDGNIYTCNRFNNYLDVTTGGSYSKIHVKPGSLVNREPSLMYSTPRKMIALRGQYEVRFKCFFSGIPAPSVSWLRLGGTLLSGRYALEASNTELVIQHVREADVGIYQCIARNSVGTSFVTFALNLESKPHFVRGRRPTNTFVTEKGQAQFNCRAKAEPPASVTWYINGEPINKINPGPRRIISHNGTRFTISNLCRDCPDGQSDVMVVQCNASNIHGYTFASGYLGVISSVNSTASTTSERPIILLAAETIDAISLSGDKSTLIDSLENVMDVDYDYDEELIFFSDKLKIYVSYNISAKGSIRRGTSTELLVNNTNMAEAIAYDWVHKVLYWTDTSKDTCTIELLTMKGRHRRTIVDLQCNIIEGIAVDPRDDQRWVYWTDWGSKPKIEKAGLDGSHRTLVVATNIGMPYDVAIDFADNRLYWTDGEYNAILSCDLSGQDIRRVFSEYRITSYPRSVDVFGDMVYWDDGRDKGVYEFSKTLRWPDARTVRRIWMRDPRGLRIYHSMKQPKGSDPCGINNGGCSHICLAAPAIGSSTKNFSCFCPDTGC